MNNLAKSFSLSFQLKNTYRKNGIIYNLSITPLIKKLIPESAYESRALSTFADVISGIIEFFSFFLGKAIYFFAMIFFPLMIMSGGKSLHWEYFPTMFVFLTVAGGFFRTQMFDVSRDKYYAMFLMRMDAREYTLSNYYYFLLKTIIGFLPFCIVFGVIAGLPVYEYLLLPVYAACMKAAVAWPLLKRKYKGISTGLKKNNIIAVAVIVLCVVAAYLLPYKHILITPYIFLTVFAATALCSVFALRSINAFSSYRYLYKEILKDESKDIASARKEESVQRYNKQITDAAGIKGKGKGYAYFNDIFVKRHRKMLMGFAEKAAGVLFIVFAALIGISIFYPAAAKGLNEYMRSSLPYFLFLMFAINSGKNISMAMFINCDSSMLTYRFYRQGPAILSLFRARVRSVIKISLIPAVPVAAGLPLLVYFSGGTKNVLEYPVLAISILMMSVLFSVHNMVLYYIFQPYTTELKMKSPAYTVITTLTYLICYFCISFKASILTFGISITAFTIVYTAAALILAYKLAPKTFKLRQ